MKDLTCTCRRLLFFAALVIFFLIGCNHKSETSNLEDQLVTLEEENKKLKKDVNELKELNEASFDRNNGLSNTNQINANSLKQVLPETVFCVIIIRTRIPVPVRQATEMTDRFGGIEPIFSATYEEKNYISSVRSIFDMSQDRKLEEIDRYENDISTELKYKSVVTERGFTFEATIQKKECLTFSSYEEASNYRNSLQ